MAGCGEVAGVCRCGILCIDQVLIQYALCSPGMATVFFVCVVAVFSAFVVLSDMKGDEAMFV